MTLNINSARTLNPIQTPTDVSHQPVYVLTKELRYHYPQLFEKYCPIMGGLHVEQSLLPIHGQLIEDSALAGICTLHNFSTIGLSVITDASHIKRARYAIQMTVCALILKFQEALVKDGSNLHPYSWMVKKSVTNREKFFIYTDKFFVKLLDGTSLLITSIMLGGSAFTFLI